MKKLLSISLVLVAFGYLVALSGAHASAQTTAVMVSPTTVSVAHPVEAKLFGVFPVTISVQTEVHSDGSVAIHYPWYGFLFSTDQAQLQTKLEAIGHVASAFAAASFTTQQQGAIAGLLQAALQANTTANASASTTLQ